MNWYYEKSIFPFGKRQLSAWLITKVKRLDMKNKEKGSWFFFPHQWRVFLTTTQLQLSFQYVQEHRNLVFIVQLCCSNDLLTKSADSPSTRAAWEARAHTGGPCSVKQMDEQMCFTHKNCNRIPKIQVTKKMDNGLFATLQKQKVLFPT